MDPKGTGLRAFRTSRENFRGSSVPRGAVKNRLTVRSETRRQNRTLPKRQTLPRWPRTRRASLANAEANRESRKAGKTSYGNPYQPSAAVISNSRDGGGSRRAE